MTAARAAAPFAATVARAKPSATAIAVLSIDVREASVSTEKRSQV